MFLWRNKDLTVILGVGKCTFSMFQSNWLGGYKDKDNKPVTTFDSLKKRLSGDFDLMEDSNMPFFIRETARKNQWTVAHATVWKRKA